MHTPARDQPCQPAINRCTERHCQPSGRYHDIALMYTLARDQPMRVRMPWMRGQHCQPVGNRFNMRPGRQQEYDRCATGQGMDGRVGGKTYHQPQPSRLRCIARLCGLWVQWLGAWRGLSQDRSAVGWTSGVRKVVMRGARCPVG